MPAGASMSRHIPGGGADRVKQPPVSGTFPSRKTNPESSTARLGRLRQRDRRATRNCRLARHYHPHISRIAHHQTIVSLPTNPLGVKEPHTE